MSDNSDLVEIAAFLDKYNSSLRLPKLILDNEAEKSLQISYEELSKMNPVELGQTAFILRKYALYLQKEISRQNAISVWLDRKIKLMVAHRLSQQTAKVFKDDHKLLLAIKENDVALKLYKIKTHTDAKIAELAFIPSSITNMCGTIENLKKLKDRGDYVR